MLASWVLMSAPWASAISPSPPWRAPNPAYSYSFTNSIHGGANIKVITESTDNVNATGVAIDAGIQYQTGENDELKFGIALKNIGPALSFGGTGMAFTTVNEAGNSMTVEFRAAEMELPTCLNIGASYDFLFEKWNQRLTLAANFTSNAFLRDNFGVGFEYSLLDRFQARAAYLYQTDIFDKDSRTTANTGLHAGASFIIPLNSEKNQVLSIDYSFRTAANMKGTHAIGATFKF